MPAACGRSPLREEWVKSILGPLTRYVPAPAGLSDPLIPIIYGQTDLRKIPERFPYIKAWAVPVHKAMNLRGEFRSVDMKDYLGLTAGQKLILSTAGPDDFMEMLWEKGDALGYNEHGFDFWFPAHFSVYDNDSKFYQFFNARRQQIHARRVKSQFVWFRLGEHISIDWLEPIRECPSILISCQQMYNSNNRRFLVREIGLADATFPLSAHFFLLGSGYGAVLREGRKIHEIRSGWLIRGLKGYDMQHVARKEISRRELLCQNLEFLYRTIATCHRL